MNENDEMEWNERIWIGVSVIEVSDRKNGMAMDGNEWIENIDAKANEKQRCVVMRVMEVKWDGNKDGIMYRWVC